MARTTNTMHMLCRRRKKSAAFCLVETEQEEPNVKVRKEYRGDVENEVRSVIPPLGDGPSSAVRKIDNPRSQRYDGKE